MDYKKIQISSASKQQICCNINYLINDPSHTVGFFISKCFHIFVKKRIMKKFSISEIGILVFCVVCIFVSEYIYLTHGDPFKAIFIGLWPPTMLGLVNFINSKRK